MPVADRPGPSVETGAPGGVEVTTHRTVVATADGPDGMTLDELAGFLRRAMAAGLSPDAVVRARTTRKGVVGSVSVEGFATHG